MRRSAGNAILAANHDLHLHSCHSDGWHTITEVAGFAIRWLEADLWVGLSDHSPFLPGVLQGVRPDAGAAERTEWIEQIARSSPAALPDVQKALDAKTRAYVRAAREERARVLESHGASLLVGLEVEWHLGGPAISAEVLDEVDYVLAGYHGRRLASAAAAEDFLRQVFQHPATDIVAHPDRFLGAFDARSCDWGLLFRHMARAPVLCEYNLMTPLPDDVLALAFAEPELQFVISSDTHDFRRRCHLRVMGAWAESSTGCFSAAQRFLDGLLHGALTRRERASLGALYQSSDHLAALEGRLWARTRRIEPVEEQALPGDEKLLSHLDADPADAPDREFLAARLERFGAVPAHRIASLMSEERFRALIARNRKVRRERFSIQVGAVG